MHEKPSRIPPSNLRARRSRAQARHDAKHKLMKRGAGRHHEKVCGRRESRPHELRYEAAWAYEVVISNQAAHDSATGVPDNEGTTGCQKLRLFALRQPTARAAFEHECR